MAQELLTSWKAIAEVFDRDVRTVQRWEKEQGLPVHRHQHHRRSSVYASRDELLAWWEQRGQEIERQQGSDATAGGALPAWRVALFGAAVVALAMVVPGGRGEGISVARIEPNFPLVDLTTVRTDRRLIVQALHDVDGDGREDVIINAGQDVLVAVTRMHTPGKSPHVRISIPAGGNAVGGPAGDVDGDGLSDLLVGTELLEPASLYGTGPTYLVRGRSQWPDVLELPRDAQTVFAPELQSDIRLGACLPDEGVDLDGDGLRDVILGATDYSPPGRPSAGGVFVFFGREQWPSRIDPTQSADVAIHGSSAGDALSPHCDAGDFTGDGRADLALVAHQDTLWGLRGARGSVYVFAGRRDWPRVVDADRDATLRLQGTMPAAWPAPLLRDVNGDGTADLVAPSVTYPPSTDGGRVAIVFGGGEEHRIVPSTSADVIIEGGKNTRFGDVIAAADFDFDDRTDLAVGDPGGGTIHVFFGRQQWPSRGSAAAYNALLLTDNGPGSASFGLAVGDYDGDGVSELAYERGAVAPERNIALLRPSLMLAIDFRPGTQPNVLPRSGVIAVAILASPALQETDVTTLRIAGQRPAFMAWRDADNDGRPDLQLYVHVASLRLPEDLRRLPVTGRTHAGVPVSGADDIVLVPPAASKSRPNGPQ